jgi:hypothetical protein
MTAEGNTIDYDMTPGTELNNVKKRLALGPQDRFWQAKLSNVDGSDFDIQSVELLEQTLTRRSHR